jgi:hypothetical protein
LEAKVKGGKPNMPQKKIKYKKNEIRKRKRRKSKIQTTNGIKLLNATKCKWARQFTIL